MIPGPSWPHGTTPRRVLVERTPVASQQCHWLRTDPTWSMCRCQMSDGTVSSDWQRCLGAFQLVIGLPHQHSSLVGGKMLFHGTSHRSKLGWWMGVPLWLRKARGLHVFQLLGVSMIDQPMVSWWNIKNAYQVSDGWLRLINFWTAGSSHFFVPCLLLKLLNNVNELCNSAHCIWLFVSPFYSCWAKISEFHGHQRYLRIIWMRSPQRRAGPMIFEEQTRHSDLAPLSWHRHFQTEPDASWCLKESFRPHSNFSFAPIFSTSKIFGRSCCPKIPTTPDILLAVGQSPLYSPGNPWLAWKIQRSKWVWLKFWECGVYVSEWVTLQWMCCNLRPCLPQVGTMKPTGMSWVMMHRKCSRQNAVVNMLQNVAGIPWPVPDKGGIDTCVTAVHSALWTFCK